MPQSGYALMGLKRFHRLPDSKGEVSQFMSGLAAIHRASLGIVLAGVLLLTSVPCTAVCSTLMSGSDIASAESGPESHCAKREAAAESAHSLASFSTPSSSPSSTRSSAPSPAPAPCPDTCAGCSIDQVSIPSSTAAIDAVSVHGSIAVASLPLFRSAHRSSPAPARRSFDPHPLPRDVLALTTTLLL